MIDWVQYLAPVVPRTSGIPPEIFLRGVGMVEIALGVWLSFVPRRAACCVAAWLGLIILNSLLAGTHFDVLRDFALLLAALALGRLASGVHRWHQRHV